MVAEVVALIPPRFNSASTLKVDIKPGDYYLLAVADAKKQLEERTRGNNIRAVRITILPAEPKK